MRKSIAVAVLTAVLLASGFAEERTAKLEPKKFTGQPQDDGTNYEVSLHDFFAKSLTPMFRLNTFLLAANYKMTDSSRKFAADFGPFFWLSDGNYDLGIRASGYYYFAPAEAYRVYASTTGGGALSLATNGKANLFIELKLGLETRIDKIELFGEVGTGLSTRANSVGLMLNAGTRYYIF